MKYSEKYLEKIQSEPNSFSRNIVREIKRYGEYCLLETINFYTDIIPEDSEYAKDRLKQMAEEDGL